jgi:diguanylate cyclase (GGDEF)-like protein
MATSAPHRQGGPQGGAIVQRPFASIVVACLFAALFALIAHAALPAPEAPVWKVAELPAGLDPDPSEVASGRVAPSFIAIDGQVLRTSTHTPRWFLLSLDRDWPPGELPVLSIADAGFTHVQLIAPPAYRAQALWHTKPDPAARFSRRALAFLLPPGLRAGEPVYLRLDTTLTAKNARVAVTDLATYQAADLRHVRVSTMFASVQLAMILVGLCLWLALRDRMFAYFVGYSGFQLVYLLLVSGEFYDSPLAGLVGSVGQKATWVLAVLSAPLSISFMLEFCNLRRLAPRMAAVLAATRWPYVLALVLLLLPLPWPSKDALLPSLINLMFLLGAVIAISTVGYAAFRGNRSAMFFLVAWMPQVVFTALRVLQILLGLPQPAWLEYGFPFTTAFSSIVVVLGLADATLHARRERDLAKGLAEIDGLTGVLNRRALISRLASEFGEARAHARPLTLLFVDLDHFKAINDRHGHLAGDLCLKAVAEAIERDLDEGQNFGRYGGEEFLVILPGATHVEAVATGERLRRRVEALVVDADGQRLRLTASIGLAGLLGGGDTPERLIERADAALYRAKAEGRNRVGIHAPLAAATGT